MKAILEPVHDERCGLVLFDIFIDGAWHGSRRTREQCREYLEQIGATE